MHFSFYPAKNRLAAVAISTFHVLRVKTWKVDIETNSNRMIPKDHLAAGTTRKVVVLNDLSNAPYPSPENLILTSIESQKCFE